MCTQSFAGFSSLFASKIYVSNFLLLFIHWIFFNIKIFAPWKMSDKKARVNNAKHKTNCSIFSIFLHRRVYFPFAVGHFFLLSLLPYTRFQFLISQQLLILICIFPAVSSSSICYFCCLMQVEHQPF
jgi:hypothetical protein